MPAKEKSKQPATPPKPRSLLAAVRDWIDPLVVAFLLAMFIRLFVAELFRIPSSSMTPTLLGMEAPRVTFHDVDGDGDEDMLLKSTDPRRGYVYEFYEKRGERFYYEGQKAPGYNDSLWTQKARRRQDQILVAKFSYWFRRPERGDIVVFKTPQDIFEREKPIFIKRVVGLPGESISFEPAPGVPGHLRSMGYLMADGKRVTEPDFFEAQRYERMGTDYFPFGGETLKVPEDAILVFGDNTVASRDGRYFGPVPLEHLRGRAILRFYHDPKFLH